MKFFRIFFVIFLLLLLLPHCARSLEKFYEQSFLVYKLSNCLKKRDGYVYQLSFFQKNIFKKGFEQKLSCFLHDPDYFLDRSNHVLIKSRGQQRLYKIFSDEVYILKVFEQKGFFKNLFKENRVMSSFSGASYLEDVDMKSLLPLAVILKRRLNNSKGYHLSRFTSADNGLQIFKDSRAFIVVNDIQNLFSHFKKNRLIHGDLTPMNVLVHENEMQVIDTSDVHYYPRYSPMFYLRHAQEISFCFRHFDYE